MKPTEFKLEFDSHLDINIGKPKHFNPDEFLDVVEQMVVSDEIVRALWMLDNMPGYYRQYPPQRAVDLKRRIYNNTWNISSYVKDKAELYEDSLAYQAKCNPGYVWDDLGTMMDIGFCQPRAPIAHDIVKEYNDKGISPFIWEMGPANYYLPYGLRKKGRKFNYFATTLNAEAFNDHKARLADVWKEAPDKEQPQIFICFETLEHLWNESDILHQYHRYGANAEIIMMSTPLNTLLGGLPNMDRELGHIRTYTPNEFRDIAQKLFPGYSWSYCFHHMQVIVGRKEK